MILTQFSPASPLDKHIEKVLHFKDFVPQHSIERVIPTGHIFLIFELDGFVRYTYHAETLEPDKSFTKVWISGMHKNFLSISAHERSEMLVVQFKSSGALPFLYFPVEQLNDQVLPAEQLFGEEIITLREKMLSMNDAGQKFAAIEQWLVSRFDKQREAPQDLLDFIQVLQTKPVSLLHELVEQYPHTQKQLILHFKKYVGLTPKYYQRILRFNEILQIIYQKKEIAWAEIAYQCGYSDQSHFIKEFTHFSGFNPMEFIRREFNQEDTNFFPLDRQG